MKSMKIFVHLFSNFNTNHMVDKNIRVGRVSRNTHILVDLMLFTRFERPHTVLEL